MLAGSRRIAEHLADDEKNPQSETEIVVLLPRMQFGSIIGKGGVKIKETRESTAAIIKVSDAPLENSSEHTITITGTSTYAVTTTNPDIENENKKRKEVITKKDSKSKQQSNEEQYQNNNRNIPSRSSNKERTEKQKERILL